MAGNPVKTVKLQWLDELTSLAALSDFGCFYSYPGDAQVKKKMVWFEGARTSYHVHSMKAGRRRRLITCRFDVLAQVILDGKGNHVRQADADELCEAAITAIDEHIADDEHLASNNLVDVAWVESTELEAAGFTDQGVASRIRMTVAFNARYL